MTLVWRCDSCDVEVADGGTKAPSGWLTFMIERLGGGHDMRHRCKACRTSGAVQAETPRRKQRKRADDDPSLFDGG